MAKAALSITLDKEIIKTLKFLAREDNRTVSNFSELIFSQYINGRLQKKPLEQSLARAKDFAGSFEVKSFNDVESALKQNVTLSDADKNFLDF